MSQPAKLVSIGNYRLRSNNLGKGTFARVELASHVIMKRDVALKIITISEIRDPYMRKHLSREAKILARLSHPNIVKMVEICKSFDMYVLVLEALLGGTLFEYLQRRGRLHESEARRMCRQLVSALSYLHRERILHRDLKLENVMMDGDRLVLIDFGLSNSWYPGKIMLTHCGSGKDVPYGSSVDVWSFGIILYALVIGQLPFQIDNEGREENETALTVLIKTITKGLCNHHYREMNRLSIDCRVLLMRCLDTNPNTRISVKAISSDPWIGYVTARQQPEVDESEIASDIKKRLKIKIPVPEILEHVRRRKYGTTAGCFNLIKLDYIKGLHQPQEREKDEVRSLEGKMHQLELKEEEPNSLDKEGECVKEEEAIDTLEVATQSPKDPHLKQSNSCEVSQNEPSISSCQNDSQAKERRSRSQDSKAPPSWRRSFLNIPSSGRLSFSRLKRTDSQKEDSPKKADSGILRMFGLQALEDITNSVRPLFRNHAKNSSSKFDTLPKSNKQLGKESVEVKNPMLTKTNLKHDSITKKLRSRAIKVDGFSHTPRKPIR